MSTAIRKYGEEIGEPDFTPTKLIASHRRQREIVAAAQDMYLQGFDQGYKMGSEDSIEGDLTPPLSCTYSPS